MDTTQISHSQFKVRTIVARTLMIVGILWTLAAAFDSALGNHSAALIGFAVIALGYFIKRHSTEHLDYRFKD